MAILFWFYKEFEICEERLRLLRVLNPATPVFGLYGGPLSEADEARERLGSQLDDFYTFPEQREPRWKWRHGDRLIARWYADRGRQLEWRSLAVFQWDTVATAGLDELLPGLRPEELFITGLRPLEEIAAWWPWVNGSLPDAAREFAAFRRALKRRSRGGAPLYACLFIFGVLPRRFLDLYSPAGADLPGFLEYKIPSFAAATGIPLAIRDEPAPWWAADPQAKQTPARERTLNAVGHRVARDEIRQELARADGRRLFHPVEEPLGGDLFGEIAARALARPAACPGVVG